MQIVALNVTARAALTGVWHKNPSLACAGRLVKWTSRWNFHTCGSGQLRRHDVCTGFWLQHLATGCSQRHSQKLLRPRQLLHTSCCA